MKGKKLLGIALAAVVALGAVVPAYAADDKTSNGKEEKSEEQIACEEKCERLEEEIKAIEEQMEIDETFHKGNVLQLKQTLKNQKKDEAQYMEDMEINGRKDLEDVVTGIEDEIDGIEGDIEYLKDEKPEGWEKTVEENQTKLKELERQLETAEQNVETYDNFEEDIDYSQNWLNEMIKNHKAEVEDKTDRLVALRAVLKETRKGCPIGDEDEEEGDDNEGEVVEPTDGDDDTDDKDDENPEECKEKDAKVVCEPKLVKAGVTSAKGDNPQTGVGSLVGLTATAVVAGAAAVANKKHNK